MGRFHADFHRRFHFLPDVDVGIIATSHLNDDETRLEAVEPFGQRVRLCFQIIFRFSDGKQNGVICNNSIINVKDLDKLNAYLDSSVPDSTLAPICPDMIILLRVANWQLVEQLQ